MRRLASQIFGKCRLSVISSGIKGLLPTDLFLRTQIMRPSFQVALSVIAALTVSMTVSADSQCTAPGAYCTMGKDECCSGFTCVPKLSIIYNEGPTTESTVYMCDIEMA
ncbi:hypothetical protein BDR07DRAFT_1430227 [Suillus spraguei]|nr:hypothetical protein BDR07DRAFT_1430227 [Suillus spraguei]